MGKTTGISWTDSTWNPFVGCKKVSQGCAQCYMFRDQKRFGNDPTLIRRTSPATFNAPLKWKGPARVFVNSWSDFFIEEADPWRDEAWDIIRRTPHLTYQILTKRPHLIPDRLPADWGKGYSNVWLGTSAENQETADERIPLLLQVPAAVRFVSYEPALAPVDFRKATHIDAQVRQRAMGISYSRATRLDWIIVGCESGPDRRQMGMMWAFNTVRACKAAGVPVFVKQLPVNVDGRVSHDPAEWPEELRVREMPEVTP